MTYFVLILYLAYNKNRMINCIYTVSYWKITIIKGMFKRINKFLKNSLKYKKIQEKLNAKLFCNLYSVMILQEINYCNRKMEVKIKLLAYLLSFSLEVGLDTKSESVIVIINKDFTTM